LHFLIKNIIDPLSHLFFPQVCAGCGSDLLPEADHLLCLQCHAQLPETHFALHANNPVEKTFWGRLSLKAACSQYYFTKESLIQTLIHQLKYEGKKDNGLMLGRLMGQSLLQSGRFGNIDTIVPLPLFADKEKRRGYNQSLLLCEGIAEILCVPVTKNAVSRIRYTETQTKKSRPERWQNVAGGFMAIQPGLLENKKVLLVDDVITTGATLEACGSVMLNVPGIELYIATLAYASQ
jgi:ComF family protein